MRKELPSTTPPWGTTLLVVASLAFSGCAVRNPKKIPAAAAPRPAQEATAAELMNRLNSRNEAIRTLTATVDLKLTAGSVYSGVIKEYHDVKGFILIEKPALIRMVGQAPVVRTNIFDMVSNSEEFRLYIQPKQKFYVGKNAVVRPAKNSLENMRPQHILDALLVPSISADNEKYEFEEAQEDAHRYYVVTVVDTSRDNEWAPKRKIWFDRADLEIARLELYGPRGVYVEDIRYSDYQDFQGVRYPTGIEVARPVEDYHLTMTIQKATFNQPLGPEKFDLKKPANAQLVDLTAESRIEGPHGQ